MGNGEADQYEEAGHRDAVRQLNCVHIQSTEAPLLKKRRSISFLALLKERHRCDLHRFKNWLLAKDCEKSERKTKTVIGV